MEVEQVKSMKRPDWRVIGEWCPHHPGPKLPCQSPVWDGSMHSPRILVLAEKCARVSASDEMLQSLVGRGRWTKIRVTVMVLSPLRRRADSANTMVYCVATQVASPRNSHRPRKFGGIVKVDGLGLGGPQQCHFCMQVGGREWEESFGFKSPIESLLCVDLDQPSPKSLLDHPLRRCFPSLSLFAV